MNLLLVDDEPLALQRLVRQCLALGFAEQQLLLAADASQAWQLAQQQTVQLCILDVDMPEQSGIELAQRLRQCDSTKDCPIIFVTAFEQHALAAFGVQAMDYLLKPVSQQQLGDSIDRALARPWLAVTQGTKQWRLPLQALLFVQASEKMLRLQTAEHEYWLEGSLKQWQQQYSPWLLRIHRSFLVNASHCQAIRQDKDGNHWLQLAHWPDELPISRRFYGAVRQRLVTA